MTIAVDFDGTIVSHAYPAIGKEMPGAIRTLVQLQKEGHRLILWTVREGQLLDEAIDYCRQKGLEFFCANEHYVSEPTEGAENGGKACRKLTADIYIDDRNVGGFPGWEAIYEMVSKRKSSAEYFYDMMNPAAGRRDAGFLHRLKRILS